jgi:hypothetical protein
MQIGDMEMARRTADPRNCEGYCFFSATAGEEFFWGWLGKV